MAAHWVWAQNDNELWMDVTASKELAKKLNLGFEAGFRLDSNFRKAKILYFEPDLSYKINKYFDVGLAYRFSVVPNDLNANRLSLFGSADYDFGKLAVAYRLKYQYEKEITGKSDHALRNRFKVDYNLSKKVDPYAAFELFFNPEAGQGEFEQIRLLFGLEFNLPKGKDVSLYYVYRNKFNIRNPRTSNVIGLSFGFGEIKKRKKKKKDGPDSK